MAKIITQSDYTRTLVRKRNDLADNIETKGVEADQTEKLNTLVPKVLEIQTGGAPLEIEFIELVQFVNEVQFAPSSMIDFQYGGE